MRGGFGKCAFVCQKLSLLAVMLPLWYHLSHQFLWWWPGGGEVLERTIPSWGPTANSAVSHRCCVHINHESEGTACVCVPL
uniref:Putative secreted protein n=1 Tax=Anopheles darlingi TaxID=43151 RepID=A0A2M4DMI4_ANODA